MPSLQTLTYYASSLLAQLPLLSTKPPQPPASSIDSPRPLTSYSPPPSFFPPPSSSFIHHCPIDSPTSCHNSTAYPDTCCFVYPGGQILLTQFWDTGPSIGPADSWTLHGLWPDLCDGSYPTFCTEAPMYHNISAILAAADERQQRRPTERRRVGEEAEGGLLDYMKEYWLPNRGSADHFWEHEWNKHGTCVNTLSPSCFSPSSSSSSSSSSVEETGTETYTPGDEVHAYFSRAVALFRTLDTYTALAAHGIVPSWTARYRRADILDALRTVTGQEVVIGCRGRVLNQAWYSFNVKGSLQEGEFVPSAPVGKAGRGGCPEWGVRYLPK
ncbi:uncharacterized protein L3040_006672 [Drepanopeziza brunnea f. sp. 'multigermtubi']|uniref:ribonuclease T2 n=1 Tax=Marssonina brunnea f. sp. multigermtubi (strain MB_m1) TaxID=1072389 RepID=K1XA13_MARBU|nr:ribonuclease T2 family protein [Drepanopeziza brunnea f. sp. 'multigermtubi' MB_m1]EKD17553.1 ribonuclease T2 family protein [Drepanopeziza brunnea f. sp. 'multigermtubi' MB_m1]KAJ5038999.1 hypothetical protein L3040_006672 [Drepanopeziza brunnea f. sp. 'multigermtubi']